MAKQKYLLPILALIWANIFWGISAWFLLAERPTFLFYVGSAFIVAGVYVVERRSRSQTA